MLYAARSLLCRRVFLNMRFGQAFFGQVFWTDAPRYPIARAAPPGPRGRACPPGGDNGRRLVSAVCPQSASLQQRPRSRSGIALPIWGPALCRDCNPALPSGVFGRGPQALRTVARCALAASFSIWNGVLCFTSKPFCLVFALAVRLSSHCLSSRPLEPPFGARAHSPVSDPDVTSPLSRAFSPGLHDSC